ncbi:MAG: hypothetical protein IT449_16165 [Phycisphaerales bacterium]|nr:hypothetical protein [Phycisphaerales bacterium]
MPKPVSPDATADAQSDRLRRAYAQLHEGRFAVIADFELPAHAQIVQVINASGRAELAADPTAGRNETGRSAMRFRLAGESDALVISGESAREWTLKRDWRGFDLLLLALEARRAGEIEIEVRSGPSDERRRWATRQTLHTGWNLIEMDLHRAAESLAIDDVREMRLRSTDGDAEREWVLDDMILTSDRRLLLGNRTAPRPELFVERQGHRLCLGVARRFELTLHQGRIVAWHDLAADPNRLSNLLAGAAMGPTPTWLRSTAADQPREVGEVVPPDHAAGSHEIIEMTPARVRIQCRHLESPGAASAATSQDPVWECTYTIYPSGQVYAEARLYAAALSPDIRTPAWMWRWGNGATVTVEAGELMELEPAPKGGEETPAPFFAVARSASDQRARLCVCGYLGDQVASILPAGGASWPAAALGFVAREGGEAGVARFQMTFLDAGADSIEEIHARVLDYLRPMELRPASGLVVGMSARTGAGFDGGAGVYRLAPQQDVLRVELDGRAAPRFSPVLQVEDPLRRTFWLYLDHRLTPAATRAADGSILFQVFGTVESRRTVEVLFKP